MEGGQTGEIKLSGAAVLLTDQRARQEPSSHPEHDPALRAAWKAMLGRLINKGARLRFFPHRVMMFLSLAQHAGPDDRREFLHLANETFQEWRRIARGIGGDHHLLEMDQALSPILAGHVAPGIERYRTICEHFELQATELLTHAGHIESQGPNIVALARFVATEMLVCMNELVASFEVELAETAERTHDMARQVLNDQASTVASASTARQLTEELGRLNADVRLISLNALIEAARAGESGATFSAVAQEIKALSAQIDGLTIRIRAELEGT